MANPSHISSTELELATLSTMRLVRFLIRRRHYPTLFLPIQRGPIHGFYHFFMGYLVPLFREVSIKPGLKYAVMDAHPLNHWFELLPTAPAEIVDQAKTVKLAYLSRHTGYARGYRVKGLVGWDKWLWFHKRNLADIARSMRSHLTEASSSVSTTTPEVIVFGRDYTPEHYATKLPTRYGTAKRNIPNLGEVVDQLSKSLDVELVDGALLTPLEMFKKVSHAKVVVGQHGAALTNLFFLRPGSHVIEVAWPDLRRDDQYEMYRLLAEELGHHWSRPILQEDKFAPISATELEKLIEVALENAKSL